MKTLGTLTIAIFIMLMALGSGCSNDTDATGDGDGNSPGSDTVEDLLAAAGYDSFEDLIEDEDSWYRELRYQSWVENGGDEQEIQYTLALLASYGPSETGHFDTHEGDNSWILAWAELADVADDTADEQLEEGKNEEARLGFLKSALYYDAASYPHPIDQMAGMAYGEATEEYLEAAELSEVYTIETISLTVEDATVSVLLHLPEGENIPVVIGQKGLDTSRITLENLASMFAHEGIAMASIDTDGLGASNGLSLQADSNRVHRALVEEIKNHPRLNGERIATYGQSIGGHASTRAAFDLEDSLTAAVNVCGAVDSIWTFPIEAYLSFPDMTIDSLGWRLGYPEGKDALEDFFGQLVGLSLTEQGFLGQEQKTSVPILNINTSDDTICTVEDMNLVADSSEGGEVVIIEGDGGEGDSHCPAAEDFMPVVVEWLSEKLSE